MSRASQLATSAVLAFTLALCASMPRTGVRAAVTAPAPPADLMFKLAKGAWLARKDAPFVTFSLRERYTWRGQIHDNWWTAYYRDSDRDLVLHRMIVPADEAARLRGFPIGLDLHFHNSPARLDSVDTSASSDAFPILDPLIEPDASFGMRARDATAKLVGNATPLPSTAPAATSAPRAVPSPTDTPSVFSTEKPLRELVHVEAVAKEYAIAFVGTEKLSSGDDAYHLTLTPLRDPQSNRLRDLWLDPSTYATLQLSIDGLFEGKPYDGARWIVSYIALGGRYYIRDIRAGDSLRFGMDRTVSDLRYDFVSYDFPASVPDTLFRRLL